ncbi:helix-turn-helix transcriptional regulator [Streptomyces sp. DSM 44917]|uniref:Helix-turn-helix transcriptional regulator n=1 Tax=Streptomyces boetiae TaxID=3075541 RepID=A0ABU2L4E5_9ACTN|nr:helix-turn-helix transcriptional regulator [Streptomyces sp. DSM 44917]MDT0306193.1 helix-turn-helix transcriptional regulator [Streptomyces sp. DSM 44917]
MDEANSEQPLSALAHFGTEVKEARRARNQMSQRHLAQGTGYSIAYVSKVEHGTLLPSVRFAENCDKVFGTGGLFARLRRRIDEGEAPSWFVPYLKLEPKAARILDYSVNCLIGVLQTEEYARAILRAGNPQERPEIIDGRVKARMRRRDALNTEHPPGLWVIVHEACLRTVVGGRAVMAEQLAHLAAVGQTPRVDLQVLPFAAGAPGAHILPFTLLVFRDATPSTLWTDGPLGGRLFQTESTVAWAMEHYERLRAHAMSPDDSLDLIRSIHREFR